MKHSYSILKISDPIRGVFNVAVCETLQHERDTIRNAEVAGQVVTTIIAARKWYTAMVHVVRAGIDIAKIFEERI